MTPISRRFISVALLALACAFISVQMWMMQALSTETRIGSIRMTRSLVPETVHAASGQVEIAGARARAPIILAQATAPAAPPEAPPEPAVVDAAVDSPPPLTPAELDQLLAPVALYPDQLLAQIFMASTYPFEVVQAARWAETNPTLKDDALTAALAEQDWDPSIKALVETPSVLKQMSDQLDWTQSLGDAVLAQQGDVMACVQRLRQQASAAGSLQTTEQQKVVTTEQQTIVIEPAQPDVVSVPYYDPSVAYGSWNAAAPPPYQWPPPPGYAFGTAIGSAIGFGVGLAVTDEIFNDDFDWDDGNIDIDSNVNRDVNRNVNRNTNTNTWQHDATHRRGVNYRDNGTRQKYAKGDVKDVAARRDFRGYDQAHADRTRSAAADRTAADNRKAADREATNRRATSAKTGKTASKQPAAKRQAPKKQQAGTGTPARTGRATQPKTTQNMAQKGRSNSFDRSSGAKSASSRGKSSRQASASHSSRGKRGR